MKQPIRGNKPYLGTVLWVGLLSLFGSESFAAASWDNPPRNSKQDVAFLDIEPYQDFGDAQPEGVGEPQFWRIAGQISFPGGTLAGHSLFGSIKTTYIDHVIVYDGVKLSQGALRRYWVAFGGEAYAKGKHSGTVMVGVGHNSDGNGPADPGWNTEWIYCHNIKVNDRLEWGLGLDAQQYFTASHIVPYPLIFFNWRVGSATELRIDADYLEARQYLTQNFSVAAGVRFNLEFFNLGQNGTYEYNSAGGETGMQYAVADHVFIRLNYKHLFYGSEEISLPRGGTHTRALPTGNSLRLNVAFGI